VRKKITEMIPECDTIMWDHENNEMFKQAHDEQLLLWLHRSVCFIKHHVLICVHKDKEITNSTNIFAAVCN